MGQDRSVNQYLASFTRGKNRDNRGDTNQLKI